MYLPMLPSTTQNTTQTPNGNLPKVRVTCKKKTVFVIDLFFENFT